MHARRGMGDGSPAAADARLMRIRHSCASAGPLLRAGALLAVLLCYVLQISRAAAAEAAGHVQHLHAQGLHLPQPVHVAAQPPSEPPPEAGPSARRSLRSWRSALSARRHTWRDALLAPRPPAAPAAVQAHQQWRSVLRRRRQSWQAALQALAKQRAATGVQHGGEAYYDHEQQQHRSRDSSSPRQTETATLTAASVPAVAQLPSTAEVSRLAAAAGTSACPSGTRAIAVAKLRFVGSAAGTDASSLADASAGIRACATQLLAVDKVQAAVTVGPAASAATFNLTGQECTGAAC